MKNSYLLILVLSLAACSKQEKISPTPTKPVKGLPEMMVTDLRDAEVEYQRSYVLDIDRNGATDVVFTTWYIGNPNEREDEILYFAGSSVETALMIDGENSSPRFTAGQLIPVQPLSGCEWYVVSQAELAKKNTGLSGEPYWEKSWKDADHLFLAVRVLRTGRFYYGWVELSMDKVRSKLILHRAAVSTVPDVPVKAGATEAEE